MIKLSASTGVDFLIADSVTQLGLVFQCSAQIGRGDQPTDGEFTAWTPVGDGTWEARHASSGVVQRVALQADQERATVRVMHTITNCGPAAVTVRGLRTVTGTVKFATPPDAPGYIHALNARQGLAPLMLLKPGEASIPLGRVPYMFFEGLVLWQGEGRPCLVTGPLTQNLVHRCQQVTWDGDRSIALHTEQDLRGIQGKLIPAGGTLELDGVFIQFRAAYDLNSVFEDYLAALREANGTRWDVNPLRREHFHAPWNNFLYWEATEADIVSTARALQRDFPDSVQWMGVDDGYEKAWVKPELERRPNGEPRWHWETELIWGHNCPGISFGFPEGLGEDREKYPGGLLALAREIKAIGRRPMLWLGIGISTHHPLYKQRREWFLPTSNGEQALLDVSVPEVRERIEHVFRTYYGRHAWEALKLDFFTHVFERTDLAYRQDNRTAAEWRRWFFEMIRRHLPEDGFVSIGCDIGVGAPWIAAWVDSYRFSNDMRDGSWENVKSNIRWSLIPALGHGFAQSIGDCDSASIFRDLSLSERTCWADYSHQIGSLVEISGDLARWSEADRDWLRGYLREPRGGCRFWFGEAACQRDGLPRVVSRWRANAAGAEGELITSLHNWSDEEQVLAFPEWIGPVRAHTTFESLRTKERGKLDATTVFRLPPRSSWMLRTA